MRSSTSPRSLRDLAVSRLRRLFPSSRLVRELKDSKPAPAAVKTANVRTATASARCSQKACAFPAVKDGLCRGHLADLDSESSVMPSTAGGLVSGRLVA